MQRVKIFIFYFSLMKKTKRNSKNIIIILAIIVAMVIAWILIAKSRHKNPAPEITTPDTTNTNTHEGIISLEIVWPEEEPKDEQRKYAPAEIKEISENNGTISLTLDMLSLNPDFQPGITDYFLNKNPKLRTLPIAQNAKAYNCGPWKDGNDNSPDVEVSVTDVITNMQQRLANANGRLTYFFDIDNGKINTIYQQCLP